MSTDTRIDASTLETWLRNGTECKMLDVRTPAEFESAHIPGAYNVPVDTIGEHVSEIARLHEPVVLVCRSGQRAGQAEQKLAAEGKTNLRVLEGGMLAWDDGRRAVNRGQQRWDLERQVRLVAGLVVLAGIVASIWVPWLKWLSAAMAAGLAVAALTNTCAMGMALARLPYNRNAASCDIDGVIRQLTASSPASRDA